MQINFFPPCTRNIPVWDEKFETTKNVKKKERHRTNEQEDLMLSQTRGKGPEHRYIELTIGS